MTSSQPRKDGKKGISTEEQIDHTVTMFKIYLKIEQQRTPGYATKPQNARTQKRSLRGCETTTLSAIKLVL